MPVQSLEFAAVRKEYGGGTVALHDFSLTVGGGEFVTLLGPSGCGKTTALNCLAGLIPLSSGELRVDGRRIDTTPPEKRGFGMVFQNYALFPHLTVEKNVAFGLELRKVPGAQVQARVRQAVACFRPEDVEVSSNGSADLTAEIELVEFLGQEYEIEARVGANGAERWPLLLRSDQPMQRGDTLRLQVPPARVAVFPAAEAA